TRRTGDLVRRVAAERDKIGHLARFDAVALYHLGGTNPGHLAGAHRLKDYRLVRGGLKGVAIAARHDRDASAPFFLQGRGSEKVVGLVTRRLCRGEPAGRDELREHFELLDELVVEDAPSLVTLQRTVPVGRHVQCVPADENRARLLLRVK